MWRFARKLSQSKVEYASTVQELLYTTIRKLLVVSGLFWLICTLLFTGRLSAAFIPALMAGILGSALILILAYRLVPRYPLFSLLLWLLGLVVAIGLGSWLLQNPTLVLFSSVLPLIAVLAVGVWAAVVSEGVVIALVWTVTQIAFSPPLSTEQALLTIVFGAFGGVVGWAACGELLTVAQWFILHFDEARLRLDEVREQRVELEQSRADLIQANRELTRLSNRLTALERIAEEALQAKTEFVANVSHELRTPLNMIIGFADVIARSPHVYGGRLPSSLLTDIAAIRRNAEHLSSLVNDVLDLSQVEAGRMALSRTPVDLQRLVEETLTVVKGLYDARGLYLKSEIIPTPPFDSFPPVYCDNTRIRQVIINLLGNAGRFTEQGGVELHCRATANEVIISVADTGPGIAAQDQARIFEPFQQADVSTRRQHGGSGLGLTISKQFVEMHGGRMWLESSPGVGTTIYFTLPIPYTPVSRLADNPAAAAPATHANLLRSINPDDPMGYRLRTRRSSAPLPTLTERFVVVDPEGTLPRQIERYLPGAEIELATDFTAAIKAVQRSPAQALVVNKPPNEALPANTLGSLPFGTPIITCWLPGEHAAARRLGAVEYLIKPLTRDYLLAALQRLGSTIKTVLLADDEEDELHLFARMLASDDQKYAVLQVTNGQRTLSMLRSRHPDVLLLDLMMPGMSGFQVLTEKALDPTIADIPVIIISSRDPSGDPIVGHTLTVTQESGLSQRNLLACIHALGEILAPPNQPRTIRNPHE